MINYIIYLKGKTQSVLLFIKYSNLFCCFYFQQARGSALPPPPPPPDESSHPEPDYEVIEFPNQAYINAPIAGIFFLLS